MMIASSDNKGSFVFFVCTYRMNYRYSYLQAQRSHTQPMIIIYKKIHQAKDQR